MNGVARLAASAALRPRRLDASARFVLIAFDAAAFIAAAVVAEALVFRTADPGALWRSFFEAPVVFVVLWIVLFSLFGLYRISYAMAVRDDLYVTLAALVIGIVPQFALFTFVPALVGSRLVLLLAAAVAAVLVGAIRMALHAHEAAHASGRAFEAPVPESAAQAAAVLEHCRANAFAQLQLPTLPAGSVLSGLMSTAERYGIGVRVALDPMISPAFRFEVEDTGEGTFLVPRPLRVRTPGGRFIKRAGDIVLALALLIPAAPFMLIAAAAVFLETGRPIFFRHERVGRDGVGFQMLKFRSMHVRHDFGSAWATRNDPRITRVGAVLRRLSIDELPQLLNVLRGDMSIVGPRPEMPDYAARFEQAIPHYAERHLVKPGITGWSQVYMQRLLTPDDAADVLRHDLFYVRNWGMLLDVSIVAKTAAEFLFHSPA